MEKSYPKRCTKYDTCDNLSAVLYNPSLLELFHRVSKKKQKSANSKWVRRRNSLSLSLCVKQGNDFGTDSFINFHHFHFMFIRSLTLFPHSLSLSDSFSFLFYFFITLPRAVCVLVKTFSIFYVLFVLRFAYCFAVLNLLFLIVTTTRTTTTQPVQQQQQ